MYFMHLISLYFIHAKTQTTFLTLIHVFKLCFDILIILWICIFMMSIDYNNMILFKEYASEFESYQNIAPERYFYYTQTHLMVRFTTALSTVMFLDIVLRTGSAPPSLESQLICSMTVWVLVNLNRFTRWWQLSRLCVLWKLCALSVISSLIDRMKCTIERLFYY